jgi:hypothetical protein
MIFFFNFLKENKMTSISMENKENKNMEKKNKLVLQLTRDLLNSTIQDRYVAISCTKCKSFKGVKNVEHEIRLYYHCNYFHVRTTLRNDYILNDLFETFTYLKKPAINLITTDIIDEVADIIIKQVNDLNDLHVIREQYEEENQLFHPYVKDRFDKSYLLEDLGDIEIENDVCCVCYKRTSTKMDCCKAYVCKVCLIEIAHIKIPKKIDLQLVSEEHKAKNKLVCPHCRKDHNDYRVNHLLWAIQGEKFEDDEDEDEDEDEDDE